MIGRTLGGYRVVEQIGLGGMATVYKAYDPNTERHVALKVLPQHYSHDPKFRKRFDIEAKSIARLEHPRILPVHGYGEEDGISYLVMRYMPTGTLKERIERGALPLAEAGTLLGQIADALDYAHQKGILHRDVKPGNVLVDDRGNAYLTDFGIAKMVEVAIDLTGTGLAGTPQYMSPEQCEGRKDLTSATDIYSLGIVLYEMVTGRPPFEAETPIAVIHKHLTEPLPPPRSLRPDLPEEAEGVILKALEHGPERRWATCGAMAQAFERSVAGHVEAGALTKEAPPGLGYGEPADTLPVSPPVRRRRVPVWVFGIVGVVLLAGLIGAALALRVFSPREPEPTPIAGGVPVEVTSTRAPAASAPTTAPHPAEAEAQAPTDIPAPTGTPSPIVKGEVLQECAQGLCVCDYDQGDCVPLGLGETYTSWWGYSWSPDGTQVVFAACLLEDFLSDPSVECCPNLYITNRDGSEVTALFPDPSHFYQFPAWSPDGEWVAFQRNCGLALIRSDGTELSLLTMSNKATCPEAIAWSPDGQRIAWLVIHDEPQAAEFAKVWVVGRDGSGIQEIFHVDNLDVRHDSQNRIAWGPDGQSVAFRLAGSSAYLLDVDCYDLPDGCDAMAPVSPYTFPEDWGHAFYPQWGGLRVP